MRLFGKRSVLERLRAAPQTIRTLYLQEGTDASEIVQAAKAAGLTFVSLSKLHFSAKVGELHVQGVYAEVKEFHYRSFEKLLEQPSKPTLFFLDRVTDPQNLGNIVRTIACFGGITLILPKHESVEVTETVLHIACGGENYVPIIQVTNLVPTVELAKKNGYWIGGAAVSGGVSLPTAQLPSPLGIVCGSEGTGIRPGLQKHLDFTFTLPMPGAAISFNVATAAALIAYEINRRRIITEENKP